MTNPDISAASVERNVLQFYQSPSSELELWLSTAQQQSEAWSWSWDLLFSQNGAFEVSFFGASTLALKMKKSWDQIPPESHGPLRQKLLNALVVYRGPKNVVTRLCVAGALLAVRGTADEIWEQPINDLVNGFGAESPILLELLTVIPEEFTTLRLSVNKQALIRDRLRKSIPDVLSIIRRNLTSSNVSDTKVQTIKCFQAWVQFGILLEDAKDIINIILRSLEDESLFEVGLDALSTVVSYPETSKYPNHLKEILTNILQLDGMLYGLLREGSFEMATSLVTLFVTFGESHSRLLIDWSTQSTNDRDMVLRFINILLSVSGLEAVYPVQETLSEMPFGFWYLLQDDIIGCDPPLFQQCVSLYGPIYSNLVNLLLKKSMYRLDEDKWADDQRERFRCYRTDIADTIMYCHNILRDDLLKNLLKHLEESIQMNLSDSKSNWPYLEATLYAWSSIGGPLADEEECPLLSLFLAKLPVVPYNHIRVISTALDCIGGFAECLAQRPQLLHHVLPIITGALENTELSLCATMALKDISRDCIDVMGPYADSVLEACTRALNSNTFAFGECIRLMYPIGKMLTLLPYNSIIPRLEPILAPHLVKLGALVGEEPSLANRPRIIFYLKMMSNLFATLDISKSSGEQQPGANRPQQPIASILPQIMQMLRFIAEKWSMDTSVSENLCDLLKQSIGTLLEESKPFVSDIVSIALSSYQSRPQSASLDLALKFFIMFGRDPQLHPLINSLFVKLAERTITEVSSSGNLSEHTEVLPPYFGMCSSVLKKVPELFASQEEPLISSVLNVSLACLSLPEDAMVNYASQFLVHFIMNCPNHSTLSQVLNNQGQNLFMVTIKCIATCSVAFVEYYGDILMVLNKKYIELLCRWMEAFVSTHNFPCDKVNRAQKEHFGQSILRERANKRRLYEVVKEFAYLCIGASSEPQYRGGLTQVLANHERAEEHQNMLKEKKNPGK